jgi:hypothetical protein
MYYEGKKPILSPLQEIQADTIVNVSGSSTGSLIKIFDIPSGLCFSCVYSHSYRSKKVGHGTHTPYRILCMYSDCTIMPDDVDYCNKYKRAGELGLDEMKDIAKLIEIDKRKVGFHHDPSND